MRYRATAPARDKETGELLLNYNGKTLGISFENGMAIFDDLTVKARGLEHSARRIAELMRDDFGYDVEVLDEDGSARPLDAIPA